MNDLQIRNSIKDLEFKIHYNDPDTRIIDELGVCQGQSIIDIAVVNGSMSGYEIKSDVDTLQRLPKQIENYNKVFDFMSIVTSQKYSLTIKDHIPKWWGIIEVKETKEGILIKQNRKPRQNKHIEAISLVQLLWKSELIELIDIYQLSKSKKNKSKREIWTHLVENINIVLLKDNVRHFIKKRSNWKEY